MDGADRHPTDGQVRVANHPDGPLLITGEAGSGRSEALALRLRGTRRTGRATGACPRPDALARRSGGAADRAEELLDRPHDELLVATYEEAAEALLRDYPVEAGLDPFFTTVAPADRMAILLERLDSLPLRRHEIRGNPAGLLARLLRRIDTLKSEGVGAARLREWAVAAERSASDAAARERAEREIEFADLYARHDRILRESGSLDGGDLVLVITKLLGDRPDVAAALRERFVHVLVDELEDAGLAHREMLSAVGAHRNVAAACDPEQAVRRFRGAGQSALAAARATWPEATEVELGAPLRQPGAIRFWRAENDRAQAQAVAREVEHLLAAGEVEPERICVIAGSGWREARLVAAALEERSVPLRFAGDAAFFGRPEVRDALAWLRMLAEPGDAAAAVRALTRPPVELRSVDLAKVTTIARRRKLDMVSALEAGLESPQLPPEARDRIQAFLRLQRGRRPGDGGDARRRLRPPADRAGRAPPPPPVRRQPGDRRAAGQPLAACRARRSWARREPRGSVRDFVRHLTAVADAGELDVDDCDRPAPGAVLVAEPEQVKGFEFDHVYLLGLRSGAISGRLWEDRWIPDELLDEHLPEPGEELTAKRRRMLAHVATSRARDALVLSWPARPEEGSSAPPPGSTRRRARRATARRSSTRRSCSGPPRGFTRPTGCCATRCSNRRGAPERRCPRCASTRPRT